MARKSTKKDVSSLKDQVLSALRLAGSKGIKAKKLIKMFGPRTPARVYDLRVNDKHDIITVPSRGPTSVYTLVYEEPVAAPKKLRKIKKAVPKATKKSAPVKPKKGVRVNTEDGKPPRGWEKEVVRLKKELEKAKKTKPGKVVGKRGSKKKR